MKSVTRVLGIVFVILLALSFASAVSVSGSFYSKSCQCETMKQKYTVYADVTGVYSVSVSGEAANWVSIAPSTLSIQGGSSADFYLFITPECYANTGTYRPNIIVSGPEDSNRAVEIVVDQCHNFDFNAVPNYNFSNPCVENTFNIYAKNTGKFMDEFFLIQNGLPLEWSNYSQQKIVLNPNEEMRTQLKVKSSCNAKPGDYSFTLTMANTRTNASKSVQLVQGINKYSPFSISDLFASGHYTAKSCEEFDKNIVFTATNLSDKNDEVTLYLLDSNYNALSKDVAYFENDNFILNVGAPVQVGFIMKKMPAQTVPVILRAHSRNYNIDLETNLSLVYENCYDLQINKSSSNDSNSCAGTTIQGFTIINNGTQQLDANVSLKDSNLVLETKSVSLGADSSQEISFVINSVGKEERQFVVSAVSAFAQADTNFVYTFENCFDSSLQAEDILVCNRGTVNQKFKIINNGSREQKFGIAIDSNWLFFANPELTVAGGQTAEFLLLGFVPLGYDSSQIITVESNEEKISESVKVITIDNEECNDINYSVQKVVDANCCDGEVIPIILGNNGYFDQYIGVKAVVPPWITISDTNIYLLPNQTGIVYLYLSPPAGASGDYNALIDISNDRNVSKEADFLIRVRGINCGPSLDADLNVANSVSDTKSFTRKEVSLDLKITNDSNIGFNVNEILVQDYNAVVDFNKSTFLNTGESLVAKITVRFREDEKIEDSNVSVLIKTSAGDFNKTQFLRFSETEPQGLSITGWFSAFNLPAVGLLLLVLLALFALALRSSKPKKPRLRK